MKVWAPCVGLTLRVSGFLVSAARAPAAHVGLLVFATLHRVPFLSQLFFLATCITECPVSKISPSPLSDLQRH